MIKRIRVPEDRLAVIIGHGGRTKLDIEKKTRTKIVIEDEVEVQGEPLDVMTATNILTAISRGFSPKNACGLLDEENTISIIDLPKDENRLRRIRSRLIGTKGKCRRNLELLTGTKISIYGRTAAIIGSYENIELAEDAITRLIKGFSHSNVYAYLEHRRSAMLHR